MARIYIKEKRFLKNFTMILLLLLVIVVLIVSIVYRMSMNAIENEIKNMYQNTTYELQSRVEDVLQQCNMMTSQLVIDDKVLLHFTHPEPDYLVDGYYSLINSKLTSHGISYIDSIMLYSPQFDSVISSKYSGQSYDMEGIRTERPDVDATWLDEIKAQPQRSTAFVVRAKNDLWPYYISIMKNWATRNSAGSVILNIDLMKLHDYLMAGRDVSMKIFLVDKDQQVILQSDKKALKVPVADIEELSMYLPGESFSLLKSADGRSYAYAQAYSEKYELTCVTYTQVDGYYTQINRVQRNFILAFILAILVAVTMAGIYSIKLVKPLQDIQRILENPEPVEEYNQYNEDIREIADRIVSQLQTNTQLREQLDSRLELLKDTQMLALQAQINPHFLFNTLNAISLTVESDCGNTHPGVQMLNVLSYILRYSLSDSGNVSIREEIEFVKQYLTIMQYRYGEIEVNIDVEEKLNYCAIPKLVLQPLVENSVQHGLSGCLSIRQGILGITVKEILHTYPNGVELSSVCIDIEDNGIGMGEESLAALRKSIADHSQISRAHIGLSNVSQRFYLMFHNEQEVLVESTFGKGTRVRVIFPVKEL